MAFVRMWNWDKNKNSGKLMAKVLPTEGIKLNAEFEADHMMIYPPKGTKAMEVILNYPVMDMSMGMPIKEAVTDEAITLSRVDTVAGQILLNTAYFVKNDLPIRIDLNHLQRDNKVPVDISYQFIDDNNQILSLLFFLEASNAASFTKFAKSAPEKPGVPLATVLKFTSGAIEIFLACTLRIFSLPIMSGLETTTCLSNLPGLKRAGSRTSGLLVAAIIITPSFVSKPSISTKS